MFQLGNSCMNQVPRIKSTFELIDSPLDPGYSNYSHKDHFKTAKLLFIGTVSVKYNYNDYCITMSFLSTIDHDQ